MTCANGYSSVYMGIEDAPVKEIMKDMMEMSRGVQHPMRCVPIPLKEEFLSMRVLIQLYYLAAYFLDIIYPGSLETIYQLGWEMGWSSPFWSGCCAALAN